MGFYNTASSGRTTSGGGGSSSGGGERKTYTNHDGLGGEPIDYGPSRGGGVVGKDKFAGGAAPFGMSPYVNSQGKPIPWSDASKTTPLYTPDAGMPQNQGYFVPDRNGPGSKWESDQSANATRGRAAIENDPEAKADLASGDWKAMTKRLQDMGHEKAKQNFIGLGGGNDEQMWNDRFKTAWPTPTMANGSRAPGAPDTAGGSAPAPGGGGGGGGVPPGGGGAPPDWPDPTGGGGAIDHVASVAPGGQGAGAGGLQAALLAALQNMPMHNTAGDGGAGGFASLPPPTGALPGAMSALGGALPKPIATMQGTPAPAAAAAPVSQAAAQGKGDMMAMINRNRAAAGLPPM